MDITMGMIALFLKNQYHIHEYSLPDRDYPVKGFQIWNGDTPWTDILYIVENEQLKEFIRKKGRLCIGIWYGEEPAGHGCYRISVNDSVELYPLINALQEIFQEFYGWSMRMERLFYTHAGFEDILNEIERTFGLVSLLVDKNLQYMAYSENFAQYNPWMGDGKTMPVELLNDMMDDENFRMAIQHDKAFLYHSMDTDTCTYCYNIKINGEYEARLLIQNKTGSVFSGGLALARYVGENMAGMFAYLDEERMQERGFYDFYEMIKDCAVSGIFLSQRKRTGVCLRSCPCF